MTDLPNHYDDDCFVAVARDPSTVFAYWDMEGDARPALEARLTPEQVTDAQWILRLTSLETAAVSTVPIDPGARNWYVTVLPGSSYEVELGALDASGIFHKVFQAGPVTTPPLSYSQTCDRQWMILEEDYIRLLALGWAGFIGSSSGLHLPEAEEADFVTVIQDPEDVHPAATSPGVPKYTGRK